MAGSSFCANLILDVIVAVALRVLVGIMGVEANQFAVSRDQAGNERLRRRSKRLIRKPAPLFWISIPRRSAANYPPSRTFLTIRQPSSKLLARSARSGCSGD